MPLPLSSPTSFPRPPMVPHYPVTIHAGGFVEDSSKANVDLKTVVENIYAKLWPAGSRLETDLVAAKVVAPLGVVEQLVLQVATIAMSWFDPHQKRRVSNDIEGDHVVLVCDGKLSAQGAHRHHYPRVDGFPLPHTVDFSDLGLAYTKSMAEDFGGGVSINVDEDAASLRLYMPIEQHRQPNDAGLAVKITSRKSSKSKKALGKAIGMT
jgi:hypothetical protein